MLCASGYFAVDADVEGLVTLLIICWWIRDIHLISQYLLSQLLDDGGIYCQKHPPWTDPAPANVADTGNDSDGSDSVGSLAAHADRMFASLKD